MVGSGWGFPTIKLNLTVSETWFETRVWVIQTVIQSMPRSHWPPTTRGISAGTGELEYEYQIDRKSTLYVGWRAADYGTADLQGSGRP